MFGQSYFEYKRIKQYYILQLNHYIFSNTHYDGDDVEYVEYNANFNRFLGSELVKEKGEGGGRERLGEGVVKGGEAISAIKLRNDNKINFYCSRHIAKAGVRVLGWLGF